MSVDKKISVIIPFFNEEENIELLVNSLDIFFTNSNLTKCEVIFVDDGSNDNSINVFLNNFKIKSFEAKIVKLSKNEGSHCAVRAGLFNASGDYAIFLPADLQDPLELIITLSNKIDEGFDIVFASRENTATGFLSSISTKIYAFLMRKYVHQNYPLYGFDVVFFNRKVINKLNENIEANSSVMLQIMTLGYRQSFISYKKDIRNKGKSKWTLSKKIKLFIDSFIAFSYAPIRFVTIIGITLFISGIGFSLYLLTRKILFNDLVSGWTMLISILTIGFGITNISLGIIAEYLWRTFDSSRKRPVFIIDDIIDLKN
jgi:glycosyltransferase involved in cell wall biosynthesis